MAKKAPKKAKPKEDYTASLTSFGTKFQATGATISEAVQNLKPGRINGRVVLTLSKGKFSKERILFPLMAKRLFNTMGVTREVHLKNVSLLFSGFDT